MQAISAKELRTKFPFVRSELKKGTTFLLIYNSKPIGELTPLKIKNGSIEIDDEFRNVEKSQIELWEKEIPPLTKEEHDYYMSLPPYKE